MVRIVRRRIYKAAVILTIVVMVTWLTTVLQTGSIDTLLERDSGQFGPSMNELRRREDLCGEASQKGRARSHGQGMDVENFTTVEFLKNFKNPCFLHTTTTGSLRASKPARVRCLPYFIIAGFPKAGTTDLWFRLLNHPDVVAKHVKEPMFFNKGRSRHTSFAAAADEYIDFYDNSTVRLQRIISPASCHGPFPYHHGVTGEGSVDTAYDVPNWQALPGNENCVEPLVTNAEYAYRLNPNMKVIFMVRNPTERLYSDYIYESRFIDYVPSAKDFHVSVQEAVHRFRECAKEKSVRWCAYNGSLETLKIRLRIGLYHIFIEDWLRVFSPNNVLVVNSDNTLGPRKEETFQQILSFLHIRPFTAEEAAGVFRRGPVNTRSRPEKEKGDMWNETRKLLDDFYRPHNEQLFKLRVL